MVPHSVLIDFFLVDIPTRGPLFPDILPASDSGSFFQDFYSGKVMGIDREYDGLYILQEHTKQVVGAAELKGKHDIKL